MCGCSRRVSCWIDGAGAATRDSHLGHSIQERASALETLRKGLKRDGRLRIKKLEVLFKLLADLLHDSNWNLRRDTLALIMEAIPKTGRRAGEHILVVLPGLINNLGDSKVAIRRGAAAAIKVSPICCRVPLSRATKATFCA